MENTTSTGANKRHNRGYVVMDLSMLRQLISMLEEQVKTSDPQWCGKMRVWNTPVGYSTKWL